MSETPNVIYGRLLEAAHFTGYGVERMAGGLEWLLDDGRWRTVGAGTYAPLAVFIWFRDGWAQVGRLVDIYRMAERIDPPLERRPVSRTGNGNFVAVTFAELVATNAVLRGGDRDSWSTWADDGNKRLARLLAADDSQRPSQPSAPVQHAIWATAEDYDVHGDIDAW